MKTVYC